MPGLPAGVKFDPTDQEVLGHLEGKVRDDARKLHPLIDEFIRTIDGENGICYTHPEKLPGDSMLFVLSYLLQFYQQYSLFINNEYMFLCLHMI